MTLICPMNGNTCISTGCVAGRCMMAFPLNPGVPSVTPAAYGWICPRCNGVNAPTVLRCNCNNISFTTLGGAHNG